MITAAEPHVGRPVTASITAGAVTEATAAAMHHNYQPQALTPLYGTPPPCVFLGAGPKPKSKKDKGRREPNVLHRAARKPWARWTELEKAELSFAANHQFWLATEAWMDDLRKDLLPVLPKSVDRIGLKPFHVAVLAGHLEVVRAFIEHRPAARRDGCYREFLVETTKNASTPFTAIELAALAGRPDVYRFLAGLQNGLGASNSRGKKRPLRRAVHESNCRGLANTRLTG